jgi:hypothetical protein
MVQVRQSLARVAGILAAGDGDGETLEQRAFAFAVRAGVGGLQRVSGRSDLFAASWRP